MNDAGEIQVISAPVGYVFELIYRCRGIPFRDGYFRTMVFAQGCLWAVDCSRDPQDKQAGIAWRPIDFSSRHEIALERL